MELDKPVRIPDRMFFRIGEVAEIVGVKPYVLRYWETEFPFLSPGKSNSQQRMYSRVDIENVLLVKHLLHDQRFSIEGAKKRMAEMRKQGELVEARKIKVVFSEKKIKALESIREELCQILDLCS